MPTPFARSMRSLELDGFRSTLVLLLAGMLLFFAWLSWFVFAEMSLYAVTDAATLEIVRQPPTGPGRVFLVAELDSTEALGKVLPEQHALFHPASATSIPDEAVRATVASVGRETQSGRLRVELEVDEPDNLPPTAQPALSGALEIEVERLSPAQLVLRRVRRVLSGPPAEDHPSR